MKEQVSLIQLNSYIRPEIKEVNSKKWVLNGENNSFYQYIIDRYNGSPTNRTIIDSYAKFIYGKGLDSKDKNTKTSAFLSVLTKLSKDDLRSVIQDYCLFGEASLELAYDGGNLLKARHVAKNFIVPNKMNEKGEIESYWFSRDFSNVRKFPPVEITSFKFKNKTDKNAIYVFSRYQAGKSYFADPIYMAGLPYAELEEEIANYCLSHIKNGLSFGHIVNMNNGEPESDEVKRIIENKFKGFGTGSSNAGRVLVNWNNSQENSITVDSIQISDAHKQYEFLSQEATQKIIISHKVTSPIIFGVMKEGGLGNNAQEMESAFNELMVKVIEPEQEFITDCLQEIFIDAGIMIDLRLTPLSKTNTTTNTTELTKLSAQEQEDEVLDALIASGEDLSNDFDVVDEEIYTNESVELSEVGLQLASIPSSFPNVKSELDNDYFKVRFEYAGNLNPKRKFCQKMIGAQKVYRKEDIVLAASKSVNPGFGPDGSNTYDIFSYKGGPNCKHYWIRKVYLKRDNKSINFKEAQRIIKQIKELTGQKVGIPESGNDLSAKKPFDMPNRGYKN